MTQWAAVPSKDKKKAVPPRWKLPQGDYDTESANAVVHFVLDETAPGETAYYFSKQFPDLRCPGKKDNLKTLADVLTDSAYPRLGEFAETPGNGTAPGQTKTTTTSTTTKKTKKGDGKTRKRRDARIRAQAPATADRT